MLPIIALSALLLATVVWIGWRVLSRRAVLPCPAEFRWLVELENPLARATRSEVVVRRLDVQPGETVLDVGCGPGRVTIPLAAALQPQGTVIAVDVQEEMLATVRSKAEAQRLGNIRLLKLDPDSYRLEVRDADAAVMIMMLGEVPEPHQLLREVQGALKPGGRLLVAESIFDPHYVSRAKLRRLASFAGFVPGSESGNFFGYNVLFQKRKTG